MNVPFEVINLWTDFNELFTLHPANDEFQFPASEVAGKC